MTSLGAVCTYMLCLDDYNFIRCPFWHNHAVNLLLYALNVYTYIIYRSGYRILCRGDKSGREAPGKIFLPGGKQIFGQP